MNSASKLEYTGRTLILHANLASGFKHRTFMLRGGGNYCSMVRLIMI